jgi:hypothetical protein
MADFVRGRWSAELEDLFLRVIGRFGRVGAAPDAGLHPGLLSSVGRKHSRRLAEYAGHNGPHGLQHLVGYGASDGIGWRPAGWCSRSTDRNSQVRPGTSAGWRPPGV